MVHQQLTADMLRALAPLCASLQCCMPEALCMAQQLLQLWAGWDIDNNRYCAGAPAGGTATAYLAEGRCSLTAVMRKYSGNRSGQVTMLLAAHSEVGQSVVAAARAAVAKEEEGAE